MKYITDCRKQSPTIDEITSICFRVTRGCNLSCSYCQAPPNAKQQSIQSMSEALDWLHGKGCRGVKFTGGEPTAVPKLVDLIKRCKELGMIPTVVTNGTILNEQLLSSYIKHNVRIKISLHGYASTHNRLQGADVFTQIEKNMDKLLESGVEVSIHSLLYGSTDMNIEKWIAYLAKKGCHKVSFMPFISRGRGKNESESFGLSDEEVSSFKESINKYAAIYTDKIIVRWLDFLDKPYIVYETDGNIYVEYDSEEKDVLLYSLNQTVPIQYNFDKGESILLDRRNDFVE